MRYAESLMKFLFLFVLLVPDQLKASESGDAQAQFRQSLSLTELFNLQVVSATRTETKLGESPLPMAVITAQEIESSGLQNLPELLARLGGVDVMRVGRSQTEVSIRGKGINFNRRLLVLIDGRPEPYNDLFGVTFWQALHLNVDDIERIEIVRGPASAQFGANAFSGVINIITKQVGAENASQWRVTAGSRENRYTGLRLQMHKPRLRLKFNGTWEEGSSYNTAVTFPGFNDYLTTNNFVDDNDSLRMGRYALGLAYDLGKDWQLEGGFSLSDGHLELVPQPGLPRARWAIRGESGHLNLSYSGSWGILRLSAYSIGFDYRTPLVPTTAEVLGTSDFGHLFFPSRDDDRLFDGESRTTNFGVQWSKEIGQGKGRWVTGAEFRRIEAREGVVADPAQIRVQSSGPLFDFAQRGSVHKDIRAAFANLTWRFDGHWLLGLGLRGDDEELTGLEEGYVASLTYFVNDVCSLRFTARRAFRAPSLNETYGMVQVNVPKQNHRVLFLGSEVRQARLAQLALQSGREVPRPQALEAETIDTYDLTYTKRFGPRLQVQAEIDVERYQGLIGNPNSGILDSIEFDPATLQFITTTTYVNLADARSQGLLLAMTWMNDSGLRLHGNLAYRDPDGLNDLPGETFFSPRLKANFSLGYQGDEGLSLDLSGHWVGKTDDGEFPFGNDHPDGPNFTRDFQHDYGFLHLKLGYRFLIASGLEAYAAGRFLGEKHVAYYEFDAVLNGVGEEFGPEWAAGFSFLF